MKVLVVDDERPARERLRRLLDEIGDCELVAEAENGDQALRACDRDAPDIVLMDIRMPGMTGVEAARHLSALEQPPAVIFTSAYGEYAMEAFDAQAVGYLMKPVRKERLARALRHAARPTRAQLTAVARSDDNQGPRQHVAARTGERLMLIPLETVRYFQADQKYVTVHHEQGETLIDEPLKDLEREFAADFVRIHRNALVSLRHLQGLDRIAEGRYVARVAGCEAPLAVSRRHAADLRRRLKGVT